MRIDQVPGVDDLIAISERLHVASNKLTEAGMSAQAAAVRDLAFVIMTILRDIGVSASMRKAVQP